MKNIDEVKWTLDHCPQYTDECAINTYSKCPYKESTECIRDVAEDALAHLEQMQSERCERCEWISVKDRLPKVPEGYWCVEILVLYQFDDSWHCRVMSYCDGTENVLNRQKGWYPALGDADFLDQFVDHVAGLTHWMYLPKPPKEEDKA